MKKVKRRSYSILLLVFLAMAFMVIFLFRLAADGNAWVTFPSNQNVFSGGLLSTGSVYDRNDIPLAETRDGVFRFNDNPEIRRATLHVLGDRRGSIGTGALTFYADKLIGYNLVNGVYSFDGNGGSLTLTVDAELSRVAYLALAGRHGSVVVINYETGEILTSVSTPTFDPLSPPEVVEGDPRFDGIFINRGFSSSFVPGSIFKVATAAVGLDTFADAATRQYVCQGVFQVGGSRVTCLGTHGSISMERALGVSCNIYFAQLALDLGGNTLQRYTEQFGLTTIHNVDGIRIAPGNFVAAEANTPALAWSGVGQSENLTNPLSMARFMGAVANGGIPVEPRILESTGSLIPRRNEPVMGERVLPVHVANELAIMLRSIVPVYYPGRFPDLAVAGKTGTAEVGQGLGTHAWFAGFLDDPSHPYAFVVLVEHGGGGLAVAGAVANTVLQAAVR